MLGHNYLEMGKHLISLVRRQNFSPLVLGYSFKPNVSLFASSFSSYTVKDHHVEKTPITAQLWKMRSLAKQDDIPPDTAQLTDKEPAPKTVAQSRLIVWYNFRSDGRLRDLYVDPLGNVMIGKVFEDLDALAGNVAHNHCDDNDGRNWKMSFVTASVDKIVQDKFLPIDKDLIIIGQVVWVGRTSMVILVEVHLAEEGAQTVGQDFDPLASKESRLLSSYFTFVARNVATGRAEPVNPLLLSTAAEQRLFSQRQAIVEGKKRELRTSCDILYGGKYREAILQLIEAGSSTKDMPALAHPCSVLMAYTALENSLVCQPQNVNTAGRVFGGFIMHRAYDLALATCYTFAGAYPVFLQSDSIAFRKPVDIGDLLRLKSRVVFTSDDPAHPRLVVEVSCQVVRPEKASSFVSNTFLFTFGFTQGVTLRKVLPVTTEEGAVLVSPAA